MLLQHVLNEELKLQLQLTGKYGMYLHVAAGGFAGIGPCNYKLFAKVIIDLKIGEVPFNIVDQKYQDQDSKIIKYAIINGIKYSDVL